MKKTIELMKTAFERYIVDIPISYKAENFAVNNSENYISIQYYDSHFDYSRLGVVGFSVHSTENMIKLLLQRLDLELENYLLEVEKQKKVKMDELMKEYTKLINITK
jgi:hypothetical protein